MFINVWNNLLSCIKYSNTWQTVFVLLPFHQKQKYLRILFWQLISINLGDIVNTHVRRQDKRNVLSVSGWRCLILRFKCLNVPALFLVEMSFRHIIPFHMRRIVVSCGLMLKSSFEYSVSVRRWLEDADFTWFCIVQGTMSSTVIRLDTFAVANWFSFCTLLQLASLSAKACYRGIRSFHSQGLWGMKAWRLKVYCRTSAQYLGLLKNLPWFK